MSWGSDQFEDLPYRFHLPGEGRWPLVIYLHGSGERGDDGVSHLKNGVDVLAGWPAVVVAPQCPKHGSWGGDWFGGPSAQQHQVAALVTQLCTRPNIDTSRVSVVGFSMGAIGGWELVTRYRELFAAFVPVAGEVAPDKARALAGFPIWAFHGEVDESVPNTTIREIAARGYVTKYTEFPGTGHNAWAEAFVTPQLPEWLLSQRGNGAAGVERSRL